MTGGPRYPHRACELRAEKAERRVIELDAEISKMHALWSKDTARIAALEQAIREALVFCHDVEHEAIKAVLRTAVPSVSTESSRVWTTEELDALPEPEACSSEAPYSPFARPSEGFERVSAADAEHLRPNEAVNLHDGQCNYDNRCSRGTRGCTVDELACTDKAVSGRTTSAQSNISNWRGPLPQGQSEDYVRGYNDALNVNRTETAWDPVAAARGLARALVGEKGTEGVPDTGAGRFRSGFEAGVKAAVALCQEEHRICSRQYEEAQRPDKHVHLGGKCIAKTLEHRIEALLDDEPSETGSTPSTCRHCHASVPNGFNCCTRCADERAP